MNKQQNNTMNKQQKDFVTVAVATQPNRLQGLIKVLSQLLPQCDRMCICFNGFKEIPKEIPKSNKIITVLANDKNGIKDLGCNNKMYWLGDFEGYYATVDDDIEYPSNYIQELKKAVDKYNRKAICSYHGHFYHDIQNGHINFQNRSVYPFGLTYTSDIVCHRAGMGVAMCCPKEIGLSKEIYLNCSKNFGDDEITAVFCQIRSIPIIRVANKNVKMIENLKLSRNGGLCTNKTSMLNRAKYLESYHEWKLNYPSLELPQNTTKPFFRIIIPTYNSRKFLSRCINSILEQTFKDYKIILVDDYSTDNTQQLIKQFEESHKNIINSVCLSEKKYAGGARNKGLEFYNDSEYTLFLDSDDYYLNNKSLEHLYSTIVFNNYPDLVKCCYQCVSKTNNMTYRFRGRELQHVVHLCQPSTSCIKTQKCPKFIENRIRFNDVVWSLRVYDQSKTLAILDEPLFIYTIGDNPNSLQHSTIDTPKKAVIYYLIGDLMNEKYSTKCVVEQSKQIIRDKIQILKTNNFFI